MQKSKEDVLAILHAVDVGLLDNPNYTVSVKKYNDIADVFFRINFFALSTQKYRSQAEDRHNDELLDKLLDNRSFYDYDSTIKKVQTALDQQFIEKLGSKSTFDSYVTNNVEYSIAVRQKSKEYMKSFLKTEIKDLLSFLETREDDYFDVVFSDKLEDLYQKTVELRKLKRHNAEMQKRIEAYSQERSLTAKPETIEAEPKKASCSFGLFLKRCLSKHTKKWSCNSAVAKQ